MSSRIWEELQNAPLTPTVYARELLFSDSRHAVFDADHTGATENGRAVIAQVFLEGPDYPLERVQRFLEAKYLKHPQLLRYYDAGTLQRDETMLTYAVTERPDALAGEQLTPEEALKFTQDLICGLEYLHRRNLVYCVLSPSTVVRVGGDWKLSDFSQLRVIGTDTSDEVRSLASSVDTSPPEAIEGLISAAWDIWSLGQTLRKTLALPFSAVPSPFRAAVLACLNVRPSFRPSLEQLSTLLNPRGSSRLETSAASA